MAMKTNLIRKLVISALLAAMVCAATFLLPIPTATGYVHPGDGLVIIAGILLGPLWGAAASGIGSMIADFLTGFVAYAPATLLIKAAMAVVSYYVYTKMKTGRDCARLVAGVCAGIVMMTGYFLFDAVLYSSVETALLAILPNLAQAAFGVAVAALIGKFFSTNLFR